MDARINVVTLGVSDLERSLAFYREGLGLHSKGVVAAEFTGDEKNAAGAIVIFELEGGLLLTLYPRAELAKDANVEAVGPGSGGFSVGQLVASRDDVDAALAQAERAGAVVTEPPRDRPWGIYSGYFRDPDGHLWEIIWQPSD
jgi:catechol 2,3-dioxygenase-like lactoylglutathione lyase family enzyme